MLLTTEPSLHNITNPASAKCWNNRQESPHLIQNDVFHVHVSLFIIFVEYIYFFLILIIYIILHLNIAFKLALLKCKNLQEKVLREADKLQILIVFLLMYHTLENKQEKKIYGKKSFILSRTRSRLMYSASTIKGLAFLPTVSYNFSHSGSSKNEA